MVRLDIIFLRAQHDELSMLIHFFQFTTKLQGLQKKLNDKSVQPINRLIKNKNELKLLQNHSDRGRCCGEITFHFVLHTPGANGNFN